MAKLKGLVDSGYKALGDPMGILMHKPGTKVIFLSVITEELWDAERDPSMFTRGTYKVKGNADRGRAYLTWENRDVLFNVKNSNANAFSHLKVNNKVIAWGTFEEKLEGTGVVDLIEYEDAYAAYVTNSDQSNSFINPSQKLEKYFYKLCDQLRNQ